TQRNRGFGRLLIEGSGFGDYERPPLTSEDYLECCETRYSRALGSTKGSHAGSVRPSQSLESVKRKIEASGEEDKASEIRRIEELEATSASQQVGWIDWRKSVNDRVKLELVPRNPSLRVERAEILYIDDKLADVYFEFYTAPGYSEPFRL